MCVSVNVENNIKCKIESEPLVDSEIGRFMVYRRNKSFFLYLGRGRGNINSARLKWKISIESDKLTFKRCITLSQLTYIILLGGLSIFWFFLILLFFGLLLTGSLFDGSTPVEVYVFYLGYSMFEITLGYLYKKLYKIDDKKVVQIFLDSL